MNKNQLSKLIAVAAGREPADLLIKNCRVIDVYSRGVVESDIAVCDGRIAGIGKYSGQEEIDAQGRFASPGFIDSHIHIESSYVSPEELGRLLVPRGTATIIADPHEIVNVRGIDGLNYMMDAAEKSPLDIKFMLPSCVPATPFEHSGAVINAKAMQEVIDRTAILGLGEFMDFPGVVSGESSVLDKLALAQERGKLVDGHSPGLAGKELTAYAGAQIRTDHECSTVKEMEDRIHRGLYVLLRQGSACHDLENLAKGVTESNSRRCLLCSDDLLPQTILESGHLDHHLRLCVQNKIDPITAIQMATLNAAECYRLYDRGALAPGLRADIVLFDSLKDFNISQVFIEGQKVAHNGAFLPELKKHSIQTVKASVRVRDFSKDKLSLRLESNKVNVIDVLPGGVLTKKGNARVVLNDQGEFVYSPDQAIVKIAVVERHSNTGRVAVALLRNYGITHGAIALSVAHDSHNIIVTGVNDDDMELAARTLIDLKGGIVLAKTGSIIESMPLPIGGIMSDQSGEWVGEKLDRIQSAAYSELGVNRGIEPVMTLSFMALPVIPEIKLTDIGLFDVTAFQFIKVERG